MKNVLKNEKKIILKITEELFQLKNYKKQLYIDNRDKYSQLIKKKFNLSNVSVVVVNFKKFRISEVLKIFFFLNNHFMIYKNFTIFFNLKREIAAYNFFPDWPEYKFLNNFSNLIFWLKKIIFIFIKFKLINFIAIKFK
jgi:hypothetical protein|tara:strand:- start:102 stop:518 length:417 start_codon:yes stop_codon:yes gene_type:complete